MDIVFDDSMALFSRQLNRGWKDRHAAF